MKVLIVDDEQKLNTTLREGLEGEGYSAVSAFSAEEAERVLHKEGFDLLLLDIMLPGKSGIALLRKVRSEGHKMPILLLTALDSVEDRVLGLDAGADDYLIKPFAFAELLARIRALLRRTDVPPANVLEYAGLHLDFAARCAQRDTVTLDLTSREFDLLEYLMINRGQVVSREMLARDVWRETSRYTTLDNVIDVQITRLRKKVDGPFELPVIHTVRGIGFILRE
jgi:DNA-binding response OmpR family regulator